MPSKPIPHESHRIPAILTLGHYVQTQDEHGVTQYLFPDKKKADEFYEALKKSLTPKP